MCNYICSFVEDETTHKEIRHKVFGWGYFLFISFMVVGMFASLITGGIYGLNIRNYMLATYSFLMSVAFVIPCVQLVFVTVKHFKKSNSQNEINAQFHDGYILINDSLKIDYAHIYKVSRTANYILLNIHEPNKPYKYLPLKKDSLNCNSETLISFIKEKRKESRTKHIVPAH